MSAASSVSTTQYTEQHAGFPSFHMAHGGGQATCDVYLNGATVASWKVAGQELLFVSPKNDFTVGKAIRGGIPVVFPQFGPGPLPQHGFARNKIWSHKETTVIKTSGDITSIFTLSDDEKTLAVWPYHFELILTVVLKSTSLSQQLTIINKDEKEFSFTTLLHTYFTVDHIDKVKISGLQGLTYIDKTQNAEHIVEGDKEVTFPGEVDRVYVDGGQREVKINDGGNAEMLIKTTGFKVRKKIYFTIERIQ